MDEKDVDFDENDNNLNHDFDDNLDEEYFDDEYLDDGFAEKHLVSVLLSQLSLIAAAAATRLISLSSSSDISNIKHYT